MKARYALFTMVVLAACAQDSDKTPADASTAAVASTTASSMSDAKLVVPGGSIWYRVTGTGTGTPVILVHGGPGFSSFYLKPFEDLGDDRVVVRYDQLGGGKSDRISDTTMFTIPHFVAELDSLRAHLGYDKVHIFGHSWGTILAMEYYRAHPEHVSSLTLGSAALDIAAYEKNARQLVSALPDSLQRAIREGEAKKKYDSPGYQAAIGEFYSRYVWRHPVQADLDSTMSTVNEGIYNYMQGPSEFTITGTLKNYNSTSLLKGMTIPILFTVGEFDEVGPAIIKGQAAMTPGAEFVEFKGSAHVTPWDARDENVRVVRDFLRKADTKK